MMSSAFPASRSVSDDALQMQKPWCGLKVGVGSKMGVGSEVRAGGGVKGGCGLKTNLTHLVDADPYQCGCREWLTPDPNICTHLSDSRL